MPDFRRGRAAIDQAAVRKAGGGSGREPFAPQIFWRADQEEKFLKFLTPMSEVPIIDRYHEWIPVTYTSEDGSSYERKNEHFISRKDQCIGEDYDDLEDRLGVNPRVRGVGVAVELEPTYETVQGRKRPKSFAVKLVEGKNGDVLYPAIGLVIQSPQNFWGFLSAYDATEQPIEDVVFRVMRQGKGPDTTYNFFPMERDVDLSGLVDNIDNVRFVADTLDADDKSPETIAQVLLDKRLDQLGDSERYSRLVSPIQEINSPFNSTPQSQSEGSNEPLRVLQDLKADIKAKQVS